MTFVPSIALGLVALIHALPSLGVLGGKRLKSLYGETDMTPNTRLLLSHRAAMFAALTAMSLAAIFVASWQIPVLLFALASVATFIYLWAVSEARSRELNVVAFVDMALMPFIVAGLITAWLD